MPPCPHFDLKIVQRSKRQSAVAAAAYQSGERLFSEYDQKQKYYSHKSEIVHTEIMLPPHAPPEYADRNTLWNDAEAIEKQWNSQLARRLVLAIPRDIPPEQQADLNVYRKLQGHWIIEMSEMIATANAKSIEEIKSFLSRQKEVYKIPYETHPEDRLRQCVFGGTSNALDFLPLDRSGNRRFLPVMVYPERAEVHILDDEAASRAYIEQVWAEAMTTYKSGDFKLSFTPEMIQYLKEHQRDFMPEDTKAGMIQAYLDRYTGSAVCSKQLFKEALNHPFDEPKQWEIREVNDIMNHGITGWKYFSNPRIFEGYGRQKGWEREAPATGADNGREKTPDGFVEVTEQMELPF